MGRLFVLGTEADPHVTRVLRHFVEIGGSYVMVDYLTNIDFTFSQDGDDHRWSVNGHVVGVGDLIWNRMKLWRGSNFFFKDEIEGESKADNYRRNMVRQQEWNASMHALKTMHADAVVNCPTGAGRMNKPFQQKVASGIGFKVPRSLITTSKAELEDFFKVCKSVIIKGQGGTRAYSREEFADPMSIMTMRLTPDEVQAVDEESLLACPQFFQEEISKNYELRVFATRSNACAFRIDSQKFEATEVDWRFGNTFLPFEPVDIAECVKTKIFRFLLEFNLNYGSFDFVVDHSGELWFLECNSDGQWGFLETHEEALMSKMLSEELFRALQARQSPSN